MTYSCDLNKPNSAIEVKKSLSFPSLNDGWCYKLLRGSGQIGDSNLYLYDLVSEILERETREEFRYIADGSKAISLKEIQRLLSIEGYPNIPLEDINFVVQFKLSNAYERNIRRDNYLGQESKYKYLDPSLRGCSAQWKYSIIKDINPNSNRVIALTADLHLGNAKVSSPKLIANFYDYVIKEGASDCVNLGDLFQKMLSNSDEEADNLLNLFYKYFPKTAIGEMMTWSIPGNNDYGVIEALNRKGYDTRWLSALNPNFYMRSIYDIPIEYDYSSQFCPEILKWTPTICGKNFHFNHRISDGVLEYKIESVDDFLRQLAKWDNMYQLFPWDVAVSAHVHDGFILSTDGKDEEHDKLFLGVPATNLENVGSAVGYLLYMYPEENCMEIAVLGADSNLKIFELERVPYSFDKNKEHHCKTYYRTQRLK